jgi:hypothetical protein
MGQLYQCWWRICWEINIFPRLEYHMFYVLYPFVTYLLTLPRMYVCPFKTINEFDLIPRGWHEPKLNASDSFCMKTRWPYKVNNHVSPTLTD